MGIETLPTGAIGLALKGAGWLKQRASRPRLRLSVTAGPGRSFDLVLKNEGGRALEDVEVRILDVEACGAVAQGLPRHVDPTVRVDRSLLWPTGQPLGRLGPKTGDSLPLCVIGLADGPEDESVAVVRTVQPFGEDDAIVAIRAADSLYEVLDPNREPAVPGLLLPPDFTYLIDAPARIRLAVTAKNQRLRVATVELSVDRHVGYDAPVWRREQSVTASLSAEILSSHPKVGWQFPSADDALAAA